jgi:hypothetical protein
VNESKYAERIAKLCTLSPSQLVHGSVGFRESILFAARDGEYYRAHRSEKCVESNNSLPLAERSCSVRPRPCPLVVLREQQRSNPLGVHSREPLERKPSFTQKCERKIETFNSCRDMTADDAQLSETDERQNFFRTLRIAGRQRESLHQQRLGTIEIPAHEVKTAKVVVDRAELRAVGLLSEQSQRFVERLACSFGIPLLDSQRRNSTKEPHRFLFLPERSSDSQRFFGVLAAGN